MSQRENIMDIQVHAVEELKCGSCRGYLSRSPVYLQHDGTGLCGECYAPERPATRNTQYEAVAKYLKFPCRNWDLGCREMVPFLTEGEESEHEVYNCVHGTYCYICWARVPRGTRAAHYVSAHRRFLYRAGSTWRAEQTSGQRCLLTSAVGTGWCMYWLDDTTFYLEVHTEVPTERLREFRCSVRVTDPYTGHTRTFTPDLLLDAWCDWDIQLKKINFPSWNLVLDVCIDIIKISLE